jgi:hypothetical protein
MAFLCKLESAPILRWLEDETFFSLCSRQHHVLGLIDTGSTLAWLYGPDCRAITHDFPGNLDSLNSRAAAHWGDVESIIHDHTIFPVFCPFQSESRIAAVETLMRSPSVGSIKYQLGLLTSRFGAEHPLRACLYCMAEDRNTHGVAYWHRTHQWPGVLLCPTHGCALSECPINRQWSGRFRWVLPDERWLDSIEPPVSSASVFVSISNMILRLAELGKATSFNPALVSQVYRERLHLMEASRSGGIDTASSFVEHISPLQPHPPFTSLPITQEGASVFIKQMTRKPRGHCHPLKHLCFMSWLFGEFSSFTAAYDHLRSIRSRSHGMQASSALSPVVLKQDVVTSNNRVTSRRPKKLKPHIRAGIIQLLKAGVIKNLICARFDITICTLNRIVRSEPGIQDLWTEYRQTENVARHRAEWRRTVKENPNASTNDVRTISPSLYAWLYRNDRDWLTIQAQQLPTGYRGNHSSVDWERRDWVLFDLVSSTLERKIDLNDTDNPLQNLYRLVPSLSRSLEKRGRYPRTRALLKQIKSGSYRPDDACLQQGQEDQRGGS